MGEPPTPPELTALALSDPPERWRALGFCVSGASLELGRVTVGLGASGEGIVGWALGGAVAAIDGLAGLEPEPLAPAPQPHDNGAIGIDHLVVMTPDFWRTADALHRAGLELRRIVTRPDGARMGFRRLGPAILELVEAPGAPPGPARFWGLVVNVADLDALAERLGELLGTIRPAVQPGRRIATLRPKAGLAQPVAFMDPES